MNPGETIIKVTRKADDVSILMDGTGSESDADLGIISITGLDSAAIQIFTEPMAMGNGSFPTGERYGEREIEITGACKANDNGLRRRLVSYFNSQYMFRLDITYRGTTRWTEGKIAVKEIPSENVFEAPIFKVLFLCTDPFFKDSVSGIDSFSTSEKAFTFPYKGVVGEHFVTGLISLTNEKYILNYGDVATYPIIRVEFAGEVVNPRIYVGKDYIGLRKTFVAGDILTIDCEIGVITMQDGSNLLSNVERGSTLIGLQLPTGDTYCKNTALSGINNMITTVHRNINYLGV